MRARSTNILLSLRQLAMLVMLYPCVGIRAPSSLSLRDRIARLGGSINTRVAESTAQAMAALVRDTRKEVTPGQLIIVRHGQSAWNYENRFTGWANVDLSQKGEQEALDAANTMLDESGLHLDLCYTSVLSRSVRTADIILDRWQSCGRDRPPTISRWRLNERHYGALTGQNKRQALEEYDASLLREWRSSFDGAPPPMEPLHRHYSRTDKRYTRLQSAHSPSDEPLVLEDVPLTESLADTRVRVQPLWQKELQPQLLAGKNVLLVGHANCLRALISCIQPGLNDEHLPSLGLPNALPLVYSFDATGAPTMDRHNRCYITPLSAHYLGDACVLFSEMDTDGNGALSAEELDDSEFCQVAYDGLGQTDVDEEEPFLSCGDELLDEADNNNDGLVDFNEYMNWWSKLPDTRDGGRAGRAERYRDI